MSLSTLSILGTTMALTLAVNLAPTATVLSYPQDRLFIAQTSSPQRPESRPRRVNNSREGLIEQLKLPLFVRNIGDKSKNCKKPLETTNKN